MAPFIEMDARFAQLIAPFWAAFERILLAKHTARRHAIQSSPHVFHFPPRLRRTVRGNRTSCFAARMIQGACSLTPSEFQPQGVEHSVTHTTMSRLIETARCA
jgi:hypothetical protein